jgi:hypothetical protein
VHSPTSGSSLSEPATRGLAGQRARSHATGVPLRLPPQGRRPVLLTRLSSVRHRLHSECRGPRRCTRQQVVRRYRSPRREALQGRGLARTGVPLRLPPQGRRPVLLTRLSSVRHRLHSECRGPRRCTRQQVVRRYRSPRREALQGRGLARTGVPLRLPPQGRRPVLLTRLSSVRRPRPVSSACTR